MVDRGEPDHSVSSALTPGSSLPSIHSRKAPPAVETKVKSSATPAWLSAATVSPPPATETSWPAWVSAAAVWASCDGGAVEGRGLEGAERAVPDQGAAGLEGVGERLDGGRADVEDHLVGRDLVDVAGPAGLAGWRANSFATTTS